MIYDIAVLGAGPGGYVAAIRAAQMGASVVVFEKNKLGGTCLNWGCIPTKAFMSDLIPFYKIKTSSIYNQNDQLSININKMLSRKNAVVNKMVKGIDSLFKANAVKLVHGQGSFVDANTIAVESEGKTEIYRAKNIIIGTGSREACITGVNIDGKKILSNKEILNLSSIPENIVIIGGGVIGVEFATIFNILGTQVTVVEILPSIISTEDEEVVQNLKLILEMQGIAFLTNTKVTEVNINKDKVNVKVQDGSKRGGILGAEKVIMAVGRVPYTDGLNIEKMGFHMDGRFIQVNERMETNVDGIYAIGDVIGKAMLAHAASAEGIVAVKNILGKYCAIDYNRIPNCIYTFPEVASVGLSEKEANESGLNIKVGKFPYRHNSRALAAGINDGFVKIIAERELGEILGVHILGEHATDLIGECLLAMHVEASVEDLGEIVKGHPTFSEAIMEAALDLQNCAIHLPPKHGEKL